MSLVDISKINVIKRGEIDVEGYKVDIPSLYNGCGLNSVFIVPTKKIINLIGSDRLYPVQPFFGKSLLCLTIFRFDSSPVGPYDEVVISIMVSSKYKINIPLIPLIFSNAYKQFGFFVVDILQSTSIAIKHGNALTGYPHNNEEIKMILDKAGSNLLFNVYGSDGKNILSINSDRDNREKLIQDSYMTYYTKGNNLFKIRMDIYGAESKLTKCKLILGNHKISSLINSLGISKHPIYSKFYNEVVEINPVTLDKI